MQLGQALKRTADWESLARCIRFSVGGADKGTTECGGFMSDQLTVFFREAFVTVCKG